MNIELKPIAFVHNKRKIVEDDNWSKVISEIILVDEIDPKSLIGLEAFSHLNIIFYMDKVIDEKAIAQYRHPRNDKNLPKVGTFAQRNKNRPNKIGLTTVNFIKAINNKIIVSNLDAINGTPILDIKPVFSEFQPKGEIVQPNWSTEIMKNYW